jgi:hypothetical protein
MTKTCPSAYLGQGGGDYYARLVGFIFGYGFGAKQAGGDSTFHALQVGFNDYVKTTLNGKHESPRYNADDHWTDVILSEAGNDSGAFKLFYELWETFAQTHTA